MYMHIIRIRFRDQRSASKSCLLLNCPMIVPELEELVLARLQYPALLLKENPRAFYGPAILEVDVLPPKYVP